MRKLSAALAVLLSASVASAQDSTDPTVDIQLFYPAPGVSNFLSVESGNINRHLGINAGLMLNYARKPLSVKIINAGGGQSEVGAVVDNRLDFNLYGAIGLFDWVDIGFVFPLVVQGGFASGAFGAIGVDVGTTGVSSFTQGDLRLVPKFRFLNLPDEKLSMAIVPTLVLPTAGGADYAGENSFVFAPSLALSTRFAKIFRFGFNVGYRLRDETVVATLQVDDEIFLKFAGAVDLEFGDSFNLEIIGEVFGHTPADNPFGSKSSGIQRDFDKARTVFEFDIGLRTTVADMFKITVGGGGGMTEGYGAPSPRIFLGLTYFTADAGPADEDGDGVGDAQDKCPKRKEDRDGFEDDDGCPDLDNDKDRVLDEDDQCPNESEGERDGFDDDDGCPDPDNDEDGLLDADDKCPNEAEDVDQFEDDDGCPDLDNDKDGVADAVDKCPSETEDRDGFMDSDGCPDPDNDGDGLADLNDLCPNHPEDKDGVADDDGCPEDNDGDGIPDDQDKCPNKPEVYNGIDDEDGCPEKLKTKSLVKVTEEKIEIKEKVFFKTGSAEILSKSNNLLDQVASVLKNYKHLTKIRIEGHTDSRGSKRKNQRLSEQRAQSVRKYLMGKGIEADRLEAVGYGPDRPIASNRSKRGREQNRRVEFVIAEQKPIGVDVSDGQEPEDAGEVEFELDIDTSGAEETPPADSTEETPPADDPPADDGETEIEFDF